MSDSDKENDMNATNVLDSSTSSIEEHLILLVVASGSSQSSDFESSGQYKPEDCQNLIDYLNRSTSNSESGRRDDPAQRQALVELRSEGADNCQDVIYISFCFC